MPHIRNQRREKKRWVDSCGHDGMPADSPGVVCVAPALTEREQQLHQSIIIYHLSSF